MSPRNAAALLLASWALAGCAGKEEEGAGGAASEPQEQATVTQQPFGVTRDGDSVQVFTLTNANGMEVRAMTYGGIILSL